MDRAGKFAAEQGSYMVHKCQDVGASNSHYQWYGPLLVLCRLSFWIIIIVMRATAVATQTVRYV